MTATRNCAQIFFEYYNILFHPWKMFMKQEKKFQNSNNFLIAEWCYWFSFSHILDQIFSHGAQALIGGFSVISWCRRIRRIINKNHRLARRQTCVLAWGNKNETIFKAWLELSHQKNYPSNAQKRLSDIATRNNILLVSHKM